LDCVIKVDESDCIAFRKLDQCPTLRWISGFRQTGTFPINRNAIPVEVFEPSKTTERQSQTDTVAEVVTGAQPGMSVSGMTPSSEAVVATEVLTDLQQSTSTSDTTTASGLI